ncbi:acyl- thioesterase 1 [Fusarium albosuccineum]|uniref:Acyl- thioesterase 1 n=1 Tax=Fusarium albosuccineum TaxID=1237068 RepID=A0A8H4P8K1_9HYPO|nr:acyl- thioesterase 1 [Fusarium albosuccineum]
MIDDKELTFESMDATGIHTNTLILLHERGSSGFELMKTFLKSLNPHTLNQILPQTRFVFPNGPHPAPEGGRDWYFLEPPYEECAETASVAQWDDVAYAAEMLDGVIANETTFIDKENVFIGGVGKGCTVAMCYLMSMEVRMGGFLGFGGSMPFVRDMKDIITTGKLFGSLSLSPLPSLGDNSSSPLTAIRDSSSPESVIHDSQNLSDIISGHMASDNDITMGGHDLQRPTRQPAVVDDATIDPRLLTRTHEAQIPVAANMPRASNSGPAAIPPLPDQSKQARMDRVTTFLRQFHWPEESQVDWAGHSGVDTPVVLVHSYNDSTVDYTHSKEAQAALQEMGFQVKLKVLQSGGLLGMSPLAVHTALNLVLDMNVGGWDFRKGIIEFFQLLDS